jgi:zinc protease
VGGFGGKSDQLNAYNVFKGDPDYFERDLGRYRRVTGESIRAAVAAYLLTGARVTLSIVPRERADLAAAGAERVSVS